MGSETFLRIERFDNGFTVEIKDPAIVKRNNVRDKQNSLNSSNKTPSPYIPYKDPWKTFVFKTDAEVITFLGKNLKKAVGEAKADDFNTSFDTCCDID